MSLLFASEIAMVATRSKVSAMTGSGLVEW
jgi:hypothetical protein